MLFWVATGLTLLVGVLAFRRGTVVDDYVNGPASLSDLNDADNSVIATGALLILVQLAAVIVLSIWSLRTVRNAKRQDPALGVSPGMACGGWYIPVGNIWLPWQQLRRAARRATAVGSRLGVWQGTVIAAGVLNAVGRALGNVDDVDRAEDVIGRLHAQGVVLLATGVLYAVATIFATKAMRAIDASTSARG